MYSIPHNVISLFFPGLFNSFSPWDLELFSRRDYLVPLALESLFSIYIIFNIDFIRPASNTLINYNIYYYCYKFLFIILISQSQSF